MSDTGQLPQNFYKESNFVLIIEWWKKWYSKTKSLDNFLKQLSVVLLTNQKNEAKLNKCSLTNFLETHHPGILLNLIFIINNFKH